MGARVAGTQTWLSVPARPAEICTCVSAPGCQSPWAARVEATFLTEQQSASRLLSIQLPRVHPEGMSEAPGYQALILPY